MASFEEITPAMRRFTALYALTWQPLFQIVMERRLIESEPRADALRRIAVLRQAIGEACADLAKLKEQLAAADEYLRTVEEQSRVLS